ncbi:MAG: hypothetical protein ACLTYN_07765 [Dysosmobacter welbionis]
MKLLTCRIGDLEQVCVLSQDSAKSTLQKLGLQDATMNDLIRTFTPEKRRLLQEAASTATAADWTMQVCKCAPIPHPVGNVICLGEITCSTPRNPTVSRRWTITANSPTRSISTKGPPGPGRWGGDRRPSGFCLQAGL